MPDSPVNDAAPQADSTGAQPPVALPTASPAPQPRPRGGGCGCWIPLIASLLIATLLVGVGLFLPPVNLYQRLFGTQYVMLDAVNNAVASDGLTLVLDPADTGESFGVALESLTVSEFISPAQADAPATLAVMRAALPPYLAPSGNIYTIDTSGTPPRALTLTLDLPVDAPARDLIDLYAYRDGAWAFVPAQPIVDGKISATLDRVPQAVLLAQAAPLDPVIHTTIEIDQSLHPNAAQVATIVSTAGLSPNLQGALVGSLAPGFVTNGGYQVMPIIRNFDDPRAIDPQTVPSILNNDSVRESHIQQIAAVALNGGYSGVFIDYRDLPIAQRDLFTRFIRDLKTLLRANGLKLGVVVPAAENREGTWDTGAYDWRALGQHVDYLKIQFSPNPADFTDGADRLVEAMLRWAVDEVDRYKLIAGLTALSLRESGGAFSTVTYEEALAELGNVSIIAETNEHNIVRPGDVITARLDGSEAVPGLDTATQTTFIDYMADDGTVAARVWLTTAQALRQRMDKVRQFGIGGVSLDGLNARGLADGLFETIFDYRLQRPSPARETELALRWRIESAAGVVQEVVTGLNEDLTVTLEAVEGNFAINVEVIDGERPAAVRSGAAVAVFAPTPTPTPLPTPTPTPEPTLTPTLEVIVATRAVASGGNVGPANNPPPIQLGPGSIAGGFEYGGHVTSTDSEVATAAMKRAGMTWMKVQIRYAPGNNPGGVANIINAARARGFKVLLGIVGDPDDLAAGGGAYIQEFANYLGGVAGLGPDAIEVWNEPNLDREWPTGQISGANYTAMLGAAYQAIKSVNPGVLVIAGAPAPTGAEAAFPGRVVNDDKFLQQMVTAGAVNYMDCMGVHYNEGVVAPSQNFGDPRDNYYSRYFGTLTDLYWNILGGQRPLCITEIGYLTPEGYGNLGDYWAWGANTTIGEQAAWLAEAIAIGSRSGKVRLMIVWNVDFQRFDANDPQAGYAIIRRDGACPACEAIAAAR